MSHIGDSALNIQIWSTSKLADADAEAIETQVWLDFALDCGYLPRERHGVLLAEFERIGKMLGRMLSDPWRFAPL